MQATGQRDTVAELALRSELHKLGLRFRVDCRPMPTIPRRADIVFSRLHLAVFMDGCFWHGCPMHMTWPRANGAWWREKIEANQRRDADTDQRLANAGWTVIRVWEHDDPTDAADAIAALALCAQKSGATSMADWVARMPTP
jgi:DNA mismatch endonuclease (patch repair protein)